MTITPRTTATSAATIRPLDPALSIIRMRAVGEITGLARATLYKRIKDDPTFPRPVPLSSSTARGAPIGFVLAEVQAWIAGQIAKRDQGMPA